MMAPRTLASGTSGRQCVPIILRAKGGSHADGCQVAVENGANGSQGQPHNSPENCCLEPLPEAEK